MQLPSPREEGRETSEVGLSVFIDDRQSAPVKEGEGGEHDETESTEGVKDDVFPKLLNADRTGDDNSDKPEDVREPEPCAELTTFGVDAHNWEGVGCQTAESTVQGLPGSDSGVCRRPCSRHRKWLTDYPEVFRD